ncbi:MAG: hypothetical protein HY097_06020 [Nitrospinae bacterium]|nr:hypothetical protein [Nitrospinota bacterium]MBI3813224.1 hypothetical protein [Nitrospinota bacterium]
MIDKVDKFFKIFRNKPSKAAIYLTIIIILFSVSFYIRGYFQERGRQKAILLSSNMENKEKQFLNQGTEKQLTKDETFHKKEDNGSTIIQESKGSQSPPIIAGGDVNIDYGLQPKTIDSDKEILNIFEKIKKKTIVGVDMQTYVELLYDADVSMKNFLKNTKANKDFVTLVTKTYNCYNSTLEIWEKGSPNALIQNGIVSWYGEAQRKFYDETVPILLKKWPECANFLEEANNEINLKG